MTAMKALLRSLLLWFLLVGVPFQGFASATMLLCGPPPAVQTVHAMQTMAMDGHHDHAAMLAAQAGADDDHRSGGHQNTGHAKCASAAACCTGAPLAPSLPTAPPAPAGRCATIPFESAAPAAVDLAGIDRPPRTIVA